MTRSVEEAWTALRDELARRLNVILLPAAISRHLHRYQAAVRARAFAEVRETVEEMLVQGPCNLYDAGRNTFCRDVLAALAALEEGK